MQMGRRPNLDEDFNAIESLRVHSMLFFVSIHVHLAISQVPTNNVWSMYQKKDEIIKLSSNICIFTTVYFGFFPPRFYLFSYLSHSRNQS